MVVARLGQFTAGLAASALAALDDYAVAASGFARERRGLRAHPGRDRRDGTAAVAVGMALNGLDRASVPAAALACWRALRRCRGGGGAHLGPAWGGGSRAREGARCRSRSRRSISSASRSPRGRAWAP